MKSLQTCQFNSISSGLSAILIAALLLSGCDRPNEPTLSPAASESNSKAASAFTIAHNQDFVKDLDLDDQQDFEDAMRGMLAAAPNEAVFSESGVQVWDAGAYDFINGPAPDTVNPSLWRQAKLNNIRGLFEVAPGIYQLRGFDLANSTLIRGETGWILVDPLTTLETTESAMAFAEQHLGKINLSGIIFTHSHIDHFGGVLALINAEQAAANKVPIIAPSGFMAESTSENIIAGPAMTRRGS